MLDAVKQNGLDQVNFFKDRIDMEFKTSAKEVNRKTDTVKENKIRKVNFKDTARWTPQELQQLHKNLQYIIKTKSIRNINSYVCGKDYTKRRVDGFFQLITLGLKNRSVESAMQRIKRELIVKKRGRFSDSEIKEMLHLRKTLGKKWIDMALIMGRDSAVLHHKYSYYSASAEKKQKKWSPDEVKALTDAIDKFRKRSNGRKSKIDWKQVSEAVSTRDVKQCMTKYAHCALGLKRRKFNSGKWSDKETKRLQYAVGYADIDPENFSFTGYSWINISNFVGTRSPVQCERHLYALLKTKRREASKQRILKYSFKEKAVYNWNQSCDIKLLSALKQDNDELSTDWLNICEQFNNEYPVNFLKEKWHLLKVSVPKYQLCNFEEVVEHLVKFNLTA